MSEWGGYLSASIEVLTNLRSTYNEGQVERAIDLAGECLKSNRMLLICGNGGSAADASHIAAELVGRYLHERRALKAMALSADSSILTAWSNDCAFEQVFARQVEAYGEQGGVLLAISTSGSSKNVISAAVAAKAKQMSVIALTGRTGGQLAGIADVLLNVPADSTPLIQQAHICLYHFICARIEERIIGL